MSFPGQPIWAPSYHLDNMMLRPVAHREEAGFGMDFLPDYASMDCASMDPSFRTGCQYNTNAFQPYFIQSEKTSFAMQPASDVATFFHQRDTTTPFPLSTSQNLSAPSPSSPESESLCSSNRSPYADATFLTPPVYGGHDLSRSLSASTQYTNDLGLVWPQTDGQFLPAIDHINMSDVQCVPDAQEVVFDRDEACYMELDISFETDNAASKVRSRTPLRIESDEIVVLKASPVLRPKEQRRKSLQDEETHDDDLDAEGDSDIPQEVDDSDRDTSYHPNRRSAARPRRTSRRPRRSPTSATLATSNRVAKVPPKRIAAAATKKHVTTTDGAPRAYICVFHFAGCGGTFATKNEWKRHTVSQHLRLSVWRCTMGSCGGPNGTTSEFNRKDLFTQHLRRMHSPFPQKARGGGGGKLTTSPQWEATIVAAQKSCLVPKRLPPSRTRCPDPQCGEYFDGRGNSWDERMEHVGRHLQSVAQGREEGGWGQDADELLVAWAAREGIIVRDVAQGRGWKLAAEGDGGSVMAEGRGIRGGVGGGIGGTYGGDGRGEEEDADYEDE